MVDPVCFERSDSDGKGGFLKWKKYKIKEGRFGPIYRVCRGVTVRQSNRGTWMIYLERNNQRKNISVGNSKDDLDRAIKMAEGIGHHSIQITVDMYEHWFPGEGRENLDEAFIVRENPKEIESFSGLKRTQNAQNVEL